MKREIYEVHYTVVDANGTWSVVNGYPKLEDSKNYDNDIEKARRRAYGDLGEIEKLMSRADTRQIQYGYIIRVSDGMQIACRKFGELADLPDPEPEPEPEPEEETTPEEPEGDPENGGEG